MDKRYFFLSFFLFFLFFEDLAISHHKIYSPRVDEERRSLEWRGHFNFDDRSDLDNEHHHVLETEYSWNNFWQSEVEFHISDKTDTPLDWEKLEIQNQVQIYDSSFYAAAVYFSYNFISQGTKGDEIEYKFLNEFQNSKFKFITNFVFEKQVGKSASGSTEFSLTNYIFFEKPIYEDVRFGIIGFSELGKISNFKTFHNQEHQYGFQFEREFKLRDKEIEFVIGYLNGLTDQSSNHSLLWNAEIEF